MTNSIFAPEIQQTIQQARLPRTERVTVAGQAIEIQKPFPSPADWRDQVIYMLMIDRFNNPDAPPRHAVFDGNGDVIPVDDFQGGTIAGITAKLDYLRTLGVTALWITPPFKNVRNLNGNSNAGTYHGYGIQDFLRLDPRFGTDAELQQLVDEAHAREMYVILDVVINHAGDVFAYRGVGEDGGSKAPFREAPADPYDISWRSGDGRPNPFWPEAPPAGDPALSPDAAVFPDELRQNRFFRRRGNQTSGLEGDFESLKELRTEVSELNPQYGFYYPVRDLMIKAYQYAIAKFDVDGFRIDTLKHVEREFARVFANAVREFALSLGKKNFFIFGEVADTDDTIARYTGRFASDPDQLIGADAALDFPLFYALTGVLKGFQAPRDLALLYENRKEIHQGRRGSGEVLVSTHGEAGRFFVTFLDNHDQNKRFRYAEPQAPNKFNAQVSMGLGCLLALQGVPVIYYGTEQGLHGLQKDNGDRNDKFVREALWGMPMPFDPDNAFYLALRQIAAVRASQPALRYGRQFFRGLSGDGRTFGISTTAPGVLAFSRILNDMEVIVVANTATERRFQGLVIVDFALNPAGTALSVLYSNQTPNATPPGPVLEMAEGRVEIHHLTGETTAGPVRVVPITLEPMEIQIIGK